MTKRTKPVRFQVERLESRQLLAATSPDYVELVSSENVYEGRGTLWQRSLVSPPVVSNVLSSPAYDLRTDVPGDQTILLSQDSSNRDGVQITRMGERFARILIDPAAVYEVNYYFPTESWEVYLDAYDASGSSLGRFVLAVIQDPITSERNARGGWSRGYIGNPQDGVSSFLQLPAQTRLIELRHGTTTIGFAGDAWDSGPQIITWRGAQELLSSRTLDLVESDQPIVIEAGKTYSLNANIEYHGTTAAVQHRPGYVAYDRDGLQIESKHVERYGSSANARLVSDLKPGDTFIELDDASGWSNETNPQTRSIAWFGYSDSSGRVYPDFSYTRNVLSQPDGLWTVGGIQSNRIALRTAWSGPLLKAGSALRNVVDQPAAVLWSLANYPVLAPSRLGLDVSGFWSDGIHNPGAFPVGTSSIRPAAELNRTLQLDGFTALSYSVSTQPVSRATGDLQSHTRRVLLDLLANDAIGQQAGTRIVSVSNAQYGNVQLLPGTTTARVSYSTAPYFVGTDRFSYTVESNDGQRWTEWVTVSSLGGNLEADAALQGAIRQNGATTSDRPLVYDGVSFSVASGAVLASRPDNQVNLVHATFDSAFSNAYSLVRGTSHGTLKLNADGSLVYQSDVGFVGTDSFEFAVSNGVRSTLGLITIRVEANVDEVDRGKLGSLVQHIRSSSSSNQNRPFYPNNAAFFDATGAPYLSWRVHLLPSLGFTELYNRFRLNEPWNSPNNLPLLDQMPDIYRSAGDLSLSATTRFHAIKAGQLTSPTEHQLDSRGIPRFRRWEEVAHGASNVLMLVRAGTDKAVPWTKPDDLAFDNANPLATLGSMLESSLPVAFADAVTAHMPKDVLAANFTALATIKETAGVTSVDGATLRRAWSEQLASPADHLQRYYSSQLRGLQEVGTAFSNYESATRLLPPSSIKDAGGNPLLSWRVLLLPYMGHAELYNRFHLNEPWNSPHNLSLLDSMPDNYRSVTDSASSNTTRLRLLNGPGTLYDSTLTRQLRLSHITDDPSKTLFAVEAGIDQAVPWTMPETLSLSTDFVASLGQIPDGTLRMIFSDASVTTAPVSTPNSVLQALATYKKGEVQARLPGQAVETRLNLRFLDYAIDMFMDNFRRYPKNFWGPNLFSNSTATPTLSWRVALLPFLGETVLYNSFHFDEPWDSPHNLSLLEAMPDVYRSKGMSRSAGLTRMQMFEGARTVLKPDGSTLSSSVVTGGRYETLAIVEAGPDKAVPWTKPDDLDGDAIDLWQAVGQVGQSMPISFSGDSVIDYLSKFETRYLNAAVERDDARGVPALSTVERIVMREGELAAIDLPNQFFSIDSGSIVQAFASPLTPADGLMPGATRLVLQAIPDNANNGPRLAHLVYNRRSVEIVVLDSDGLFLVADQSTINEASGEVTLTVSRAANNLQTPLTIQITTSHRDRLVAPTTLFLPAGEAAVSFTVRTVDNQVMADSTLVRVTASAGDHVSSSTEIQVVDDERLQLNLSTAMISEREGTLRGSVTRTSGTEQALTVNLSHTQSNRVRMPAQVTIPAGESTVFFDIAAIDNQIYDGNVRVDVMASVSNVPTAIQSFLLTDFEEVGLAFNGSRITEAGQSATLTITRLADSFGQPLTFKLQNTRPDRVQLPESVVIPGDRSQATVTLISLDNQLLDGLTTVHITALFTDSLGDYTAGVATLEVADNESLAITISQQAISERDGTARVKLNRSNTDIALPLEVDLFSSPPRLLAMPSSITIPAGDASVEFDIVALDNEVLSGEITIQLEAKHPAYLSATAPLIITDYEPLKLLLEADASREGTQLVASLTRSGINIDAEAIVRLSSSDRSEAEVPSSVIIPAGARAATFRVTIPRDRLADGPQLTRITANADGYISADAALTVLDDEFLSLDTPTDRVPESSGFFMVRLSRSDLNSPNSLAIRATISKPELAYMTTTSLVIEAQQTAIEFPVFIADDRIYKGNGEVRITFTAENADMAEAALDLSIVDDDRLWHNLVSPLDVNQSGAVSPLDALLVINYVNQFNGRSVGDLPVPVDGLPMLVDTSHDHIVSALDALLVINYLNSHPAGEAEQGETKPAISLVPGYESLLEANTTPTPYHEYMAFVPLEDSSDHRRPRWHNWPAWFSTWPATHEWERVNGFQSRLPIHRA